MIKKTLAFIVLALLFLAFVAFSITFGHATTTKKNRANSLGVTEVYTNPNTYMFGSLAAGTLISRDQKIYTVIRFQPYSTMGLYTEEVLFCGDQAEQFNGKTGAVVVTYETRAHKMVQGIGCHELISVFEVQSDKVWK